MPFFNNKNIPNRSKVNVKPANRAVKNLLKKQRSKVTSKIPNIPALDQAKKLSRNNRIIKDSRVTRDTKVFKNYYVPNRNDLYNFKENRGFLKAVGFNLQLDFQLNPVGISDSKDPEFAANPIKGTPDYFYVWTGASERSLSFEVTFDATRAAYQVGLISNKAYFEKTYNPRIGLLNLISILDIMKTSITPETFTKYRNTKVLSDSELAEYNERSGDNLYRGGMRLQFVYGVRSFLCVLKSAPVTEVIHNSFLVPERITVPFTLAVLKEDRVEVSKTSRNDETIRIIENIKSKNDKDQNTLKKSARVRV